MDRRSFVCALGAAPLAARVPEARVGLIDEVRHAPVSASGRFTTGLTDLDAVCGPFGPGDLIVIAGPSMSGKTTLALSVAKQVCDTYARDTLYWGPHVHEDGSLTKACRTLAATARGAVHVQCMNERLDLATVPADRLGLLIVDDFPYHLALRDPRWSENPRKVTAELVGLQRLAARYGCAVMPIIELGSDGYPDGRLSSRPPRLTDFGPIAPVAQRLGRILLMHRPVIYEELHEAWVRVAEVEMPRQCARPRPTGGRALVMLDAESGLYRGLADDELPSLFIECKPDA